MWYAAPWGGSRGETSGSSSAVTAVEDAAGLVVELAAEQAADSTAEPETVTSGIHVPSIVSNFKAATIYEIRFPGSAKSHIFPEHVALGRQVPLDEAQDHPRDGALLLPRLQDGSGGARAGTRPRPPPLRDDARADALHR